MQPLGIAPITSDVIIKPFCIVPVTVLISISALPLAAWTVTSAVAVPISKDDFALTATL